MLRKLEKKDNGNEKNKIIQIQLWYILYAVKLIKSYTIYALRI